MAVGSSNKRLVYLCDWLPPDFGAVGQYAMLEARQWAHEGWDVTLVGLTSGASAKSQTEPVGQGSLTTIRVHRGIYQKKKLFTRLIWTICSNVKLLVSAFGGMRRADSILFTGSPPLMLHFIAPLNVLLRKRLIYRIMDFHPECLIAERGRSSLALRAALRLTYFWRHRIYRFEVLGHDQIQRLVDCGIPKDRICLKANRSPVAFSDDQTPLPLPSALKGCSGVILYSGNWGVAHDEQTFIEGYAQYVRETRQPLQFWLNATGAKADRVECEIRSLDIPIHRSSLVPLTELPRLLKAVDVHLVTLRDSFVGYVVPSKIHACIDSGKRVLFIGSEASDVHRLAASLLPVDRYYHVRVNDARGLVKALHDLEHAILSERASCGVPPLILPNPESASACAEKR